MAMKRESSPYDNAIFHRIAMDEAKMKDVLTVLGVLGPKT
jgi:hypothetical protein